MLRRTFIIVVYFIQQREARLGWEQSGVEGIATEIYIYIIPV